MGGFLSNPVENLLEAAVDGNLKRLKKFAKKEPRKVLNLALRLGAKEGQLEIVRYLVEIGCDPRDAYDEALVCSASYGHLDVVQYLTSLGCSPSSQNWFPMNISICHNYFNIVHHLMILEHNPKLLTDHLAKHKKKYYGTKMYTFILSTLTNKDKYSYLHKNHPTIVPQHTAQQITLDKNFRRESMMKIVLRPRSLAVQMYFI
jgi:hypothetical protein